MKRSWKIIVKLIISFVIAILCNYHLRESFLDTYGGNGAFHTILAAIMVIIVTTVCIVYPLTTLLPMCFKLAIKNMKDFFTYGMRIFLIKGLARWFSFAIPLAVWLFAGYYLIEWFKPIFSVFEGILLFVYFALFLWIDLIKLYKEYY